MRYLEVVNWDRFQHYKDRRPPWIKMHAELLDDYEFGCLQDASKLHQVLIWLLASQCDNRIPDDPRWVQRRLNLTGKVNLQALVDSGFMAPCKQDASDTLASCGQSAMPEAEAEAEAEADLTFQGATPDEWFARCWHNYPKRPGNSKKAARTAWDARSKQVPPDVLLLKTEQYAAQMAHEQRPPDKIKMAATFYGPSFDPDTDYGPVGVQREQRTDDFGEMRWWQQDAETGEWKPEAAA